MRFIDAALDEALGLGYNGDMARTLSTARIRGRAKKRETPLGIAVAWGLATTLAVAILIVAVQFLEPRSALREFYLLVHYNSSATLPLSPLYQEWYEEISKEDVVGSAFSLLCGGLAVGWLAPSYASRRRVLLAGLGLGFGVPLACLAFLWIGGVVEQNALNVQQGGQQVKIVAPASLIVAQAFFVVVWAGLCVLGAGAGLALRARRRNMQGAL